MNHPVRFLGCAVALATGLVCVGRGASADEDEPYPPQEQEAPAQSSWLDRIFPDAPARREGESGWTPSLAMAVDVQRSEVQGRVISALRGDFSDSRVFVSANPVLRGELLTPVLLNVAGRPRFFAHAAWQWGWLAIEDERFVIEEGNPSEVRFEPSNTPTDPPADLADGQGSKVDLEIRDGWYAGAGIDLVVPIFHLDFHFKPSADYYEQDLKYTGAVRNATCQITFVAGNPRCVAGTQQVQAIDAGASDTLRALGPRLGIEVDLARAGPLGFSMFVEGFVYWLLDDGSVEFAGQSGPDSARFSADVDPFVAGGSAGLRASWRGFPE